MLWGKRMACHSLLAPAALLAQDPTVVTRARSLSTYVMVCCSTANCYAHILFWQLWPTGFCRIVWVVCYINMLSPGLAAERLTRQHPDSRGSFCVEGKYVPHSGSAWYYMAWYCVLFLANSSHTSSGIVWRCVLLLAPGWNEYGQSDYQQRVMKCEILSRIQTGAIIPW